MAIILGCSTESDPPNKKGELNLLNDYELSFNDPSGLTFDSTGNNLWVVSSESGGRIYKISLNGENEAVLPYEGDDMEGITLHSNNNTLWVAEERLRQIIELDKTGTILRIIDVPVEKNNENDGLEGIAINPENNHIYILNEKSPRVFIEMNDEMEVIRYEEIDFEPPFVMTDLSGLFFERSKQEFWIVSDESRKIVVTDYDLNPRKYFNLDQEKFEGIAVDVVSNIIYLVNDEDNRLYVYEILN